MIETIGFYVTMFIAVSSTGSTLRLMSHGFRWWHIPVELLVSLPVGVLAFYHHWVAVALTLLVLFFLSPMVAGNKTLQRAIEEQEAERKRRNG